MKRKVCDAHRVMCSSELGRIVLVDIVLLLFIISSLGVIAFKWYQAQPKRAESQANWNSQIITQTPSRIGPEGQTAQYWNLPGKAWQGLLAEGKAIGGLGKGWGLEEARGVEFDAFSSAVV